MKYDVRTNQFCALANDKMWHSWLDTYVPDLHKKLTEHMKDSKSCKSNKELMIEIWGILKRRNLGEKVIKFLQEVFPIAVRVADEVIETEDMNNHVVFRSFKPHILTFPQKKITIDKDTVSLRRSVRRFTMSKIFTDYVIIGDRAYIEYFEPRFKKEAKKIPEHKRDIFQFKKRLMKSKDNT
jgi:hypothetical protein